MTPEFDYASLREYGKDVFISGSVEIRRPALVSVGNHVAIDTGFYCTVAADIGDYIHIGPYTTIIGGPKGRFTMGHFSAIAAGCRFICVSDELLGYGLVSTLVPAEWRDKVVVGPIVLEKFVIVGTNAVIVPGVTLGEGTVVGANSLVMRDTEPWTVYVGTPARPLKPRPRERMLAAAKALGYT